MKKTCVIFDMDGLMFDTQCIYDRAFHDVLLQDFGLELPDGLRLAMMGRSGSDLYRTVNLFFPKLDAAEYVRRSFAAVADRVKDELVPRPGLYELLPWLRDQGIRLGLASGSDRSIVESNLRVSGLKDYFPVSVSGDEVTMGKPHPEGYLRVLDRLGCAPEDCYILEDSPNGIRAGHRAGCSVLMVPNTVEPDEEIRGLCTGIYETLTDVKKAMESGIL